MRQGDQGRGLELPNHNKEKAHTHTHTGVARKICDNEGSNNLSVCRTVFEIFQLTFIVFNSTRGNPTCMRLLICKAGGNSFQQLQNI